MSLNIKSEEAHRLARELSEKMGANMTVAVTTALREKLEKMDEATKTDLAERLMAIGRDCAERLKGKPLIGIEDLYDKETGLPK